MTKMVVTQVTFLANGEALVAGVPVDDQTKLVIAAAPTMTAIEISRAMADGMEVTAEPPDESVRDILEQP